MPGRRPAAFDDAPHRRLDAYRQEYEWSWDAGRFTSGGSRSPVRLARWVHLGERDHDVYVVSGRTQERQVRFPLQRDRLRAHVGGEGDVPLRRGAARPARAGRVLAGPDLAMAPVRELGQRGADAVRRLWIRRRPEPGDGDRDAAAGTRSTPAWRFAPPGTSSPPPGAAASPNDWSSRTDASFRDGRRSIRLSGVGHEHQQ